MGKIAIKQLLIERNAIQSFQSLLFSFSKSLFHEYFYFFDNLEISVKLKTL